MTHSEGLNAIEAELQRIAQKYPHMKGFELENNQGMNAQQEALTDRVIQYHPE